MTSCGYKTATTAALAAILSIATPHGANAADLGGDCCADLEERIAELEATTARKGNRKVSLTVTGYVAQEITFWDDGEESNVYLHGLGPTQASNFRLLGKAQIMPGTMAGYLIRIQNLDDDPFARRAPPDTGALNQDNDNFGRGLLVQMSYWFVENKDLGKVSVGLQAHAGKSAAMFTDQSGTQLFSNYTFLSGFPQFIIRSGGDLAPAALTFGQASFCYTQALALGGDCNGIVMNGVRYDTPAFAGFTASASWGEDDFWEVGLRYTGELAGFKVLGGVAYSNFSDENTTGPSVFVAEKDSQFFQIGGYVQHMATGLFLHGSYGKEENNDVLIRTANGARVAPDSDHWYVKAGVRAKLTPLGATVFYGEYAEYNDQLGPAALGLGATSSTFERIGGGIAQEIDVAAMTMYMKYSHYDVEFSGATLAAAVSDLDTANFFSLGAVINY
jgi:hypothetical protein